MLTCASRSPALRMQAVSWETRARSENELSEGMYPSGIAQRLRPIASITDHFIPSRAANSANWLMAFLYLLRRDGPTETARTNPRYRSELLSTVHCGDGSIGRRRRNPTMATWSAALDASAAAQDRLV